MTDIRAAERIAMRPAKYKGKKVSMDGVELLRGPYSVEAEADEDEFGEMVAQFARKPAQE